MTKEEFAKGMAYLGNCFGIPYTPQQTAAWYTFFVNDSYRDFVKAIGRLVCTSSYKPTIHALKAELVEVKDETFRLDVVAEWKKVRNAISGGDGNGLGFFIEDEKDREAFVRAYGRLPGEQMAEPLNEFTAAVVEEMGGLNALRQSGSSIDYLWREFERKFNDKLAGRKRVLMLEAAYRTSAEVEGYLFNNSSEPRSSRQALGTTGSQALPEKTQADG